MKSFRQAHEHKAYIGLGSNLGDAIANIRTAVARLSEIAHLCACSSFYQTKPWGYLDQPDFINAVAAIETNNSPYQLQEQLSEIEKSMGREKTSVRWGPRLIDLDILTFDDLQIEHINLTIPHPQMFKRAFVLAPLAEIDKSYEAAYLNLSKEERLQIKQL